MTKSKAVKLWYLYDFANSFASIALLVYYPLMVTERGAGNGWIAVSASVATGILLLILPSLGAYSDRTGKRIGMIKICSALMVVSLVMIAFIMQWNESLDTMMLLIVSALYILFQVAFQGSYVFYSAMLRDIADQETNTEVSGIGLGIGQLGNAFALGIFVPILGSGLVIIGLSGKPLALLFGTLMFILLGTAFLLQREPSKPSDMFEFSYKGFLKRLASDRRKLWFLVGYSLLADTILTFQLYVALYVQKVFDFSDTMVTFAGITGLLCGVAGGFLATRLVRNMKNKEAALGISSIFYAACFVLCAFTPAVPILIFIGLGIAGISYSLVFSLSRVVYSELSPDDRQGESFSVFTVFERAASIVGPLAWLLTFTLLKPMGEIVQYRGSVLVLGFICIAGYLFLRKSARKAVS